MMPRNALGVNRMGKPWPFCVAIVTACTPASENTTTSIPRSIVETSAQLPDSGVSEQDAAVDADDSAGAQYARREWVITRGNGTLVFEASGDVECQALPDKRPTDFTLILVQRRGEPGDWTYYGLSEKAPCHFPWSMSWMDPPPAACQTLDGVAFDKLYAEFRALSPKSIRSRHIDGYVSPHRGGWAIHWRWGQVECDVSDIMDMEVDSRDRKRFDAAQDLVRKAYQKP